MANKSVLGFPLVEELTEDDKARIFEQYKLLIDSLDNTNTIRENSNQFWMAVNGLCISGIAYIKENQMFPNHHKLLFLSTLIVLGIFLCFSWFNFLNTIKYTTYIRNNMLIKLENYFPIKVFTQIFNLTESEKGKSSLTLKEMLVPSAFLVGYFCFALFLCFFTEETMAPSKI